MIPAPPVPVIAALIAALAMPFLLAIVARAPIPGASLSRKFWVAMASAALIWLLPSLLHAGPSGVVLRGAAAADIAAGALLFITAALVVYSVWSLACFGFTVSMLLILHEARSPLPREKWEQCYGNGRGMRGLTEDRVDVLLRMKLARTEDARLALASPFARRFASFVQLLARLFAVARAG